MHEKIFIAVVFFALTQLFAEFAWHSRKNEEFIKAAWLYELLLGCR